MFVAIFAWNRVYACVRGGFVVGPFCDVCEFLLVCDVIYMISIPNVN